MLSFSVTQKMAVLPIPLFLLYPLILIVFQLKALIMEATDILANMAF